MSKKPIFATPQDAEAAFYEALERADLEGMMAVWAEDEEIVCTHPNGPRLAGYAAVRESWRRIFEGGPGVTVTLSHQVATQAMLVSVHSLHEHLVARGERSAPVPVIATNVYVRGALGWRMLLHHASTAPREATTAVPKTLH